MKVNRGREGREREKESSLKSLVPALAELPVQLLPVCCCLAAKVPPACVTTCYVAALPAAHACTRAWARGYPPLLRMPRG